MKYNVSDIVRAAKQIADLENSDFISWNENIRLINEAWTSVYQKLINKGDQAWIKETYLKRGTQPLPSDHYQTFSILDNYNNVIPRYSIGMNNSQLWYKTTNGNIELNGIDNAKLTYYPEPQFLTYTADTIEDVFTLPIGGEIISAIGNYFLLKEGTTYKVYEIDTGKIISNYNNGNFSHVDTHGAILSSSKKPIYYSDGRSFYYDSNKKTDPHCLVPYTSEIDTITFDGVYYYVSYNNSKLISVYEQDNSVLVDELTGYDSNIYFSNGHKFYIADQAAYIDDIPLWDASNLQAIFMLKIDTNTGYGLLAVDNGNGVGFKQTKLLSAMVDTELNFPNNLYYNVLAYQLAFAYCCKQGKDPTLVNAQLNNNTETLFDSLSNDAFGQMKVTNVYNRPR